MEIDNIMFQYDEGIITEREAYFQIRAISILAANNWWKSEFPTSDFPELPKD